MRARLPPVLVALCAGGCEPLSAALPAADTGVVREQEALVVSPASIDFGTISVLRDGYALAEFVVTNAGTATVAVHGHDEPVLLEGEDHDGVFEVAADPVFELAPGESRTIQVAFRPPTEGSWRAELRIDRGLEVLELRGAATAPVAVVSVDQAGWAAAWGCAEEREVVVENAGSELLVVEDATVTGSTDFEVVDDPAGRELLPGASTAFPVRFGPAWSGEGSGQRAALLTVSTNDPHEPAEALPLSALAYGGARVTERFTYAPGIEADLLLVADTDGAMGAHLAKLSAAADTLVDALDAGNVDVHIAFATGEAPCPVATATSDESRSDRIDAIQAGVLGPPGPWSDRLLDLAEQVLLADVPGGCAEGFLRPGAQLHVVALAGGADASSRGLDAELQALADAAPDAAEIVVSAVIATEGAGCGGLDYGAGYADAAVATGGAIGNACADDWTAIAGEIAAVSTLAGEGGLAWPLERAPVPESIEVRVDGATWTEWSYDAEANAVVFADDAAPEAGSTVEVAYVEAVDCSSSSGPPPSSSARARRRPEPPRWALRATRSSRPSAASTRP